MKEQEYDIVSIGGGTAGLVAAAGSAYLGARSALIERDRLGGDCLWTGCVPSKALIASAKRAHGISDAGHLGLSAPTVEHDFGAVMKRMRDARGVVAHHDDPDRFRAMGVAVHHGAARFLGPNVVEVEGVGRIRSKRFVIATGAEAWVPPIQGLAEAGYLTNANVFETDTRPDRLIVLGGGPIGLELAQVYSRLGTSVTVLEMLPQLLPKEDADVGELLRTKLEAEGIKILTGRRVIQIDEKDGAKRALTDDNEWHEGDEILVATGRRANTHELGLEEVGVTIDRGVKVDDHLRTTAPNIWAAGDVTGGLQFTHVAEYMAKTVIQNALLPVKKKADYSNVPWVTYTDPEVAHVGMSEEAASERGAKTYRYDFADLDRAIADGDTTGFVKISADKKGRVMGGDDRGWRSRRADLPAGVRSDAQNSLAQDFQHDLPLSDTDGRGQTGSRRLPAGTSRGRGREAS